MKTATEKKVQPLRTSQDLKRERMLRERKGKLRLVEFTPRERFVSSRVAEFLLWCAERFPGSIITFEELTQAVYSLGSLPRAGSPQVKTVVSSVYRARAILRERFKRDIISEKGIGARATTGSVDVVACAVTREVANYERSCNRLRQVAAIVNQAELAAALELPGVSATERAEILTLQEWFTEKVAKVVKRLEGHQAQLALPPPPPK